MNTVTLIGRLNWQEIKYFESGKSIVRALISEKQGDEWVTFPVTIFDTKKHICEDFAGRAKKGDYVKVSGKLGIDKYKTKDGKDVEKICINVFEVEFVKWNPASKKFEPVDAETQNVAESLTAEVVDNSIDEEIPF